MDNTKHIHSIGDIKYIHYMSNSLTTLPFLLIHIKFKLINNIYIFFNIIINNFCIF